MSLRMRDRDYVPDRAGGFQRVSGGEALLEDALFQLSARRGAFPLLPEVGSRLYLLPREKPSARETVARDYAQEALEKLGITVTGVTLIQGDVLSLTIEMEYRGTTLTGEVTIN